MSSLNIPLFFIYIRARDIIYMVDITSLKVRLARLRLGSEFDNKHPELADPVTIERKKKKQKKAAQDPYNEYTKNTGGKRKKKNKLTRSDQKRNAAKKKKKSQFINSSELVRKDLLLDAKKKKNKLTRSDQKRGKQDLVADENRRNTKLQKKKKKKRAPRVSDTEKSLREREMPGVSQDTWDELDSYPELMSDPE